MTTDQTLISQNPFAKASTEEKYATATIIYHPDTSRIGDSVVLENLKFGDQAEISRLSPPFTNSNTLQSNPLGDPYISRKPIKLTGINGGLHFHKPAELSGNITINGRLLVNELFIGGEEWQKGLVISLCNRAVIYIHYSPKNKQVQLVKHGLLGESNAVHKLREAITRVADLSVPVLIRGETGTGKELVAQAIHQSSTRKENSFVSINIAALPESLAVSELFGSKKGSFTGAAKDRAGYFQQANEGSLFLDEIGDAQDQVQVALLRTLETGEVMPVGASSPIHVDVRLITATDANLESRIADNNFRSPLLQRLAGFEIHIPPLRQRKEDIGRLLISFLLKELSNVGETRHLENSPLNVSFWAAFFAKACLYDWPGNIRQLINIAQQLAIYNRDTDQLIIPDHIIELFSPSYSQATTHNSSTELNVTNLADNTQTGTAPEAESQQKEEPASKSRRKPSTVTEPELHEALELSRWDLKATSERLNISRAALYKMIDNTASVRTAGDIGLEELQSSFSNLNGDLERMVDALKVSKAALIRRLKDLRIDHNTT